MQRGGLAALQIADAFVPGLVARLRACRDRLVAGLQALPGVTVAAPPGGMYASFRVAGRNDWLACAKDLVAHTASGWRRAWPSAPKARAGCAGALRRRTRRGSTSGCSGWPLHCPDVMQL